MAEEISLSDILLGRWRVIRALTYDCLANLDAAHLDLTLPFPESRSLGYQFWCILGAQESYLREVEHGEWQGFASSLDEVRPVTPGDITRLLRRADDRWVATTRQVPLETRLRNGKHVYEIVQRLIEHEMLHHGQIVNFLFCHCLPIPKSWQGEWGLVDEA